MVAATATAAGSSSAAPTTSAMVRTPDGHGRLERMQFHGPVAVGAEPNTRANTLGIRRLMFAVDDSEDVVARMRTG